MLKRVFKLSILCILGIMLVGCGKYKNIPHENKEGEVIHTKEDYDKQTTEFQWDSGISNSGEVGVQTTEAVQTEEQPVEDSQSEQPVEDTESQSEEQSIQAEEQPAQPVE